MNDFGEFLSFSFIETVKDAISNFIHLYKEEEGTSAEFLYKDTYKQFLEEHPRFEAELCEAAEKSKNYQRKILPWEQVEETYEVMKAKHERKKRNDIIVVASLIEKVPNLGGLSRTCEIFNASVLVIPSLKFIEDPLFKSLSVGSEKWQPIYEVPEKDLLEYLKFQKSRGYKLLGLEQTATSKMLQKFSFPEKCVLLLGEEKTVRIMRRGFSIYKNSRDK